MLRFHPVTVREVHPEAEDAIRLVLDVSPELEALFRTRAGQHIVLRNWLEGTEVRRTYSPTGPAGELPLTLGIRIQPGGRLSQHIYQTLRPGDAVEAMPPGGSFGAPLAARGVAAPLYVMFAAGSGITPVLSIVRTALSEQQDARVILFYGNRSSARAMFLEDLQALKNRYLARLAVHYIMSAEPQEVQLLNGRIDGSKAREFARSLFDPRAAQAYFLCGPGDMMEQVSRELRALGVAAERIHAEHFSVVEPSAAASTGARSVAGSVAAAQAQERAPEPGVTEVTVLIDGRRRTFTMRTGAETILDAASRAGLELPYSCRAGVCSTCRTRLARGKVNMLQNHALEDWELEQGFILACQSHAESEQLELDYDTR